MPNTYVGKLGLPLTTFQDQIKALMDVRNGIRPAAALCEVEPKVLQRNWYKGYYESAYVELLSMVPSDANSILSVGCGWGAIEAELKRRGAKVTALPLDSVIGGVAERNGIEMVYGTIDESLSALKGRKFDCGLITNLLHLLQHPWRVLEECARLVENGGTLVLMGPNFEFLPHLINRVLGVGDYRKLGDFQRSGLNAYGIRMIEKQIMRTGLRVASLKWVKFAQARPMVMLHRWPKRLVARNWIIQARKERA
jgi:2-polyprenyl-3-methyl-5-hydroxy-6-metoxy-1,4-benzoquinol methylase